MTWIQYSVLAGGAGETTLYTASVGDRDKRSLDTTKSVTSVIFTKLLLCFDLRICL